MIYSDGSLLEQGLVLVIGAGIYAEIDNKPIFKKAYSLGNIIEVYDSELWAIDQATRLAYNAVSRNNQIRDIWVFTDNQAAIQRLQSQKPGPGQRFAINIWEINEEFNRLDVNLYIEWVPGHCEVKGNEIADKLAKEGASKADKSSPYTSIAYLKRKVKELCLKDWEEQ